MKRASYRHGIDWIALNDDPNDMEVKSVRTYISVLMLADLFNVTEERVAADVVKVREQVREQELAAILAESAEADALEARHTQQSNL